jgi:hypothetical protein
MPDYGNALDFGSGGKVDITFGDPFAGADPTTYAWGLGVWMKRGNYTDTSRRLLHMQDQGGNDAGDIWLDTNGRFGVRHYTSEDSAYSTAICSTNPSASTWICVGITFNATGVINLYLGTETTSMAEVSYFAQNDAGVGWRNMAGFGGPSWIYGERQNGTADWAGAAGDGADELTLYTTAPTSSEWEEWRTTGAITGKTKVLYIASANPPVDAGSIGATVTPRATVALMTGPNVSTSEDHDTEARIPLGLALRAAASTTRTSAAKLGAGTTARASAATTRASAARTPLGGTQRAGTATTRTVNARTSIGVSQRAGTAKTATSAATIPVGLVSRGSATTARTIGTRVAVGVVVVGNTGLLITTEARIPVGVSPRAAVSSARSVNAQVAVGVALRAALASDRSVVVVFPVGTTIGAAASTLRTVASRLPVGTVVTAQVVNGSIVVTIGQRAGGRANGSRAGGGASRSRAGGIRSRNRA